MSGGSPRKRSKAKSAARRSYYREQGRVRAQQRAKETERERLESKESKERERESVC